MKKITLVILSILFYSCSFYVPEKELIGSYISHSDSYIIDSLIMFEDNSYRRVIRTRDKNELLYEKSDTWVYSGKNLVLKDFPNMMHTGKEIIESKKPLRMNVIITSFSPHIDILGDVILDIGRYNYFTRRDN
ncbi:MAG: hypothetical protein HRU40_21725 [Saprospiraceae bacterium]|nr:hypothetical protein [Saprospiraceae bacterium]